MLLLPVLLTAGLWGVDPDPFGLDALQFQGVGEAGTTATQSVAGSITPSGAVTTDSFSGTLAGSVTPTGDYVLDIGFEDGGAFQGTVTPSGSATSEIIMHIGELDGEIAPSGALTAGEFGVGVFPAGSITPTGALAVPVEYLHSLAGSIAPSGAVTDNTVIAGLYVALVFSRSAD